MTCSSVSESSGLANMVERPQLIVEADVIEQTAQSAAGHPQPVGPAESAELSTPLEVRLQFQEDSRQPQFLHAFVDLRQIVAEIAEDGFVATVPPVAGDKVLQPLFIDDTRPLQRRIDP